MNPNSKSAQRGYSLIELSIALAVVGVVIAGSIIGVQAILRSNNVNKTIVQTNTAIGKIIAKLVRDADYTNATTQNLSKAGMEVWAATDIISGGTTSVQVTHPLSSRIYVQPLGKDTNGVITGQGLIYTLTGIPVAACSDLAVGLEGLAYTMTIKNEDPVPNENGLDKLDSAKTVKTPAQQFNSATANTLCTGADAATGVVPATASTQATISFLVPRR